MEIMGNFAREIYFFWVVGIRGMISIILTFFKAKKQHSVNIEHQLKLKLARPVCKKSIYEVKIKYGTGSMTTAKSEVLIRFLLKKCYSVGAINFWCGESTVETFGQ